MARLLTKATFNYAVTYCDIKYVLAKNISHFVGRANARPILKIKYNYSFNRYYVGLAARLVRGILKIRYLVIGSAVGGGMTLNKKYIEWRDGLPDMTWLNDVLPDNEQFNKFTKSLVQIKDNFKNIIDADDAGGKILKELSDIQLILTKRLENARKAAGLKNEFDEENVIPSQSVQAQSSKKYFWNSVKSILPLEDQDLNSLPDDIRAELITMKSKHRKRLLQIKRNTHSNVSLLYQDIQSEITKKPKVVNLNKKLKTIEEIVLPQIRAPRLVILSSKESDSCAVLAALLGVDLFCRIRYPISIVNDEYVSAEKLQDNTNDEILGRRPVEVELVEGANLTATIFLNEEEKQFDLSDERQLLECQRLLATLAMEKGNLDPIRIQVRGDYLQPIVVVYPSIQNHADRLCAENYAMEPHALILHVQNCHDQDKNDEAVKELVQNCDPDQKRSILTVTGLHQLLKKKVNLQKLNSYLDSNYLDTYYVAIDPFDSDSIKDMLKAEEVFFKKCPLVSNGTIKVTKSTFPSLRYQILDHCHKVFLQNIEQQEKELLAISMDQDLLWRRIYGSKARPLDSEDVMKRAFDDVLDKIASLKRVKLSDEGWCKAAESFLVTDMVEAVMYKIINTGKGSVGLGESSLYGSVGTRTLRNWIHGAAGKSAVSRAAHHALECQLSKQSKSSNNQGPLAPIIADTSAKIAKVILRSHLFESTENESNAISLLSEDILEESEILDESDWQRSIDLLEKSISGRQNDVKDDNESLFLKHAVERLKSCKNGYNKHQLKEHNAVELECPEVLLFYKIQQIALVMSRCLRQQMLERHADKVDKLARIAAAEVVVDPSKDSCLQMAEDINHVRRLLQLLENLKKSLKPDD